MSLKAINYQDFAITFGIVKNYTPNPYTLDWTDEDWAYVASYLLYEADKRDSCYVADSYSHLQNENMNNKHPNFTKLFAPLAPFVSITYEPMNL